MEHFEDGTALYDWDERLFTVTIKPGIKMDVAHARNMVETRLRLTNSRQYPVLMKVANSVSFTKDGRDYLGTDESVRGVGAAALLADNAVKAAIANFFMKVTVQKPKVPTRIFNNEVKALQWLEQFK